MMIRQCDNYDVSNQLGKMTCPLNGQPAHYTECCSSTGRDEVYCCPAATLLHQIDSNVLMIVALIVMVSCLLAIIVVLVCCFSSRCPLYNACGVNYTQGGVIAYTKEEDPLTGMPGDGDGQKDYSPGIIKIKPVAEV